MPTTPVLAAAPGGVETGRVGAARFADVVDSARRRAFVGRRNEIAGFEEALAGRSARRVLFVHGPGGIGKTTLLLEMRARARGVGRGVVLLDGREIDPSPEGLTAALRVEGGGDCTVLLIDGYEQLAPVDGWLRRELIPSLPARDVVVLAGRDPPAPAWRTDPGWRELVAVHPLDHLDDADSAEPVWRLPIRDGWCGWAAVTRWPWRCSPRCRWPARYRRPSPRYPT